MKAAVIEKLGDIPRYEDFPDPVLNDGEVIVNVKAVILDYAVKILAAGTHFASRQLYPDLPAIVGNRGIGSLEDGTLVSFQGIKPPFGSMAEKVVIPKAFATPIPKGITAVQAAVIPSAALSSLGPLRYTAKLQPGETVLINGATSVSGMLAIQIAKYLGAGKIIGTGRNPESGEKLRELGADAFINLNQSDEQIIDVLKKEGGEGYDVILDYLWGHPAEVIISSFTPNEIRIPNKRTRFVLIGGLAGWAAQIPGQSLLTSGLEIYGMMGAQTPSGYQAEATNLIWDMIIQGKLSMDVVKYPLEEIEKVWNIEEHGKRIVIVP